VNIGGVDELKYEKVVEYDSRQMLEIGAAHTLSEMRTICEKYIETYSQKSYKTGVLTQVVRMLHWFAGRHIRNMAVRVQSSAKIRILPYRLLHELCRLYPATSPRPVQSVT
jgi:hypothetical protein